MYFGDWDTETSFNSGFLTHLLGDLGMSPFPFWTSSYNTVLLQGVGIRGAETDYSSSDKPCLQLTCYQVDQKPTDAKLLESDVDGVLGEDPSPCEFKAMVQEPKAQKCSESTDGQIHPLEVHTCSNL